MNDSDSYTTNMGKFVVYFEEFNYQSITELPAYTVSTLKYNALQRHRKKDNISTCLRIQSLVHIRIGKREILVQVKNLYINFYDTVGSGYVNISPIIINLQQSGIKANHEPCPSKLFYIAFQLIVVQQKRYLRGIALEIRQVIHLFTSNH